MRESKNELMENWKEDLLLPESLKSLGFFLPFQCSVRNPKRIFWERFFFSNQQNFLMEFQRNFWRNSNKFFWRNSRRKSQGPRGFPKRSPEDSKNDFLKRLSQRPSGGLIKKLWRITRENLWKISSRNSWRFPEKTPGRLPEWNYGGFPEETFGGYLVGNCLKSALKLNQQKQSS